MGQLSVWVGGLRVGLWVNVARNLRLKAVTYPDLGFEVTSVLDRLPDIGRGRRARFGGGQRRGLRVTHSCVRGWAATGSPSHPLMWAATGSPSHPLMRSGVGSDGVSESPAHAFEGGQRRGLRVTHSCVRGWAATGSPSHPLMRSRVGSDGVSESPAHAFGGGQQRGLWPAVTSKGVWTCRL